MVRLYLQVWCSKGLRYLQLKRDLTKKKTLNHSCNLHDVAHNNNNNDNNNNNNNNNNHNNNNNIFYNNYNFIQL